MIRLLAAALCAFSVGAFARDLPAPVRAALADAKVPLDAVGVVVEPVDAGAPVISHRADAPMNPASVMKLVTSYAALDLLGPAFTFHTDVLVTGTLADGILDGDVFIRGGGDPKLTYERLWQLMHQLRARGLREIRGDIVIDRSYFAPPEKEAAPFDAEPRRAYNVGPDAFLVNFQSVQFTFEPSDEAVRVTAEPDLPNLEITTRLRAVPGACGWWRRNLRYEVEQNGMLALVSFSGTIPADCAAKTLTLAVLDPQANAESTLRWTWGEAGGKLRGKVRSAPVPADARPFYSFESEPLATLVHDMNKFSNNVMARHIYLALSAQIAGGPGTEAASRQIVLHWLDAKHIDARGFVPANGSGLSRDSRISATTLAALLRSIWASPFMPELAASLPVFATDGTLKLRPATAAAGHAHLKGGTLDGVQSIAGYVIDRNGKRWIVVMMANHANANAAQPALDALVEWVFQAPR